MRNHRIHIIFYTVLVSALVVACAAATQTPGRGLDGVAPPAAPDSGGNSKGQDSTSTGGQDRMIVRTAQLSLVVTSAESGLDQIRSIVAGLQGYVVDTRLWRENDQLRGTVTVRVPSEALDEAVSTFKGLAVKVQSESGNSQDITEQYSDLSAQLRNLEATEQELRELLTTVREKTGKAEDILAVYRELASIRGQIEQIKGRMQYLEQTSAMAAVTIELIPDILARPIAVGGWRPGGTVANALRALLGTLQTLGDAAIWALFYLVPILAALVVPFGLLVLLWRRRRSKVPSSKS